MKLLILLLSCILHVRSDSVFSDSYELLSLYSNHNLYLNDVDDVIELYDTFSDINYYLNDEGWFDGIKTTFKKYKEKSINWVAKNGDKVAGVLEKVSKVADVVEKVAGVTQMVATGASLIPGVNVIAAPIAAAASATYLAAKATKVSMKTLKHGVKIATAYSKGYKESGGNETLAGQKAMEQLKESGKSALKFGISEAASVAMVVGGGAVLKRATKLIPKRIRSKIGEGAIGIGKKVNGYVQKKFPKTVEAIKKFDQKMLRKKKNLALKKSLKKDVKIAKAGGKSQMKLAKKSAKQRNKVATKKAKNQLKDAKNRVKSTQANITSKKKIVQTAKNEEQKLLQQLKNAPNRVKRRSINKQLREVKKKVKNASTSVEQSTNALTRANKQLTNAKDNLKIVKQQKSVIYKAEMEKGKQNAKEIADRMRDRMKRKTSRFKKLTESQNTLRQPQLGEKETFMSKRKEDIKDALGSFTWKKNFSKRYIDDHRIMSRVAPISSMFSKHSKKITEKIVGDKLNDEMSNGETGKQIDKTIGKK